MKTTRWAGAALVLGASLAGCAVDAVGPRTGGGGPLATLEPGIHPVLIVEGGASSPETRVEVHLRRVKVDEEVASYQGELGYDAAAMTLSGAEFAAGMTGMWNEVSPGRLRFAAVVLEGVGQAPVLVLRFAPREELRAESFTLAMEEVVARETYTNLTARVVGRQHPLFVAANTEAADSRP